MNFNSRKEFEILKIKSEKNEANLTKKISENEDLKQKLLTIKKFYSLELDNNFNMLNNNSLDLVNKKLIEKSYLEKILNENENFKKENKDIKGYNLNLKEELNNLKNKKEEKKDNSSIDAYNNNNNNNLYEKESNNLLRCYKDQLNVNNFCLLF